eukprot:TRINITY_DN3920_c0_g1_i2.p1 TRINITY_DN3920_c0_g1~~TRINITY_DN3920_c0_g1_i2.p1  ORF type:complete len:254 (-),score=53.49 TRINITY_DN3920_c0_g1_i2:93-854(-)
MKRESKSDSTQRTRGETNDQIIQVIKEGGYTNEYILETHAHADHITGAQYFKKTVGGKVGIGAKITEVQETFRQLLNINDLACDGSQFDVLFQDGDSFQLGNITVKVFHTPGHTPACVCYLIGDALFTGDTIFMPDYGTARCDFPGGSSCTLYDSIQKIYALGDDLRVFVGHDYAPGREHKFESTLKESKNNNKHVTLNTSAQEYVEMRNSRDATLDVPRLLFPAIQVNIRAGHFPPADENGSVYLRVPMTFN